MPSNSFITFTVRNLPLGTTGQDIRNHVNSLVSNAQPLVGSIIREPTRALCYTTVTIRQDSDGDCAAAREKLNGSPLYPQAPASDTTCSQIIVSQEFLGVTTLVEHENAQFDVYFVHGLGGHGFKTWTTDKFGYPQMWPRDFFPNDVKERPCDEKNPDGPKLRGRFSTIGYQAHALSSWSATTTIEKAADNLLTQIKTDRPEGSDRPMYFACHSLGGLVACQALIHAFHSDSSRLSAQEPYKKIFSQNGECLVKGIFFFGTPFSGSKLANHASKIVKFLNGNSTLVNCLRDHSDQLAGIVGKFNQIRYHNDTKIPILIAYEMLPMYGVKFVTQPDSAMGSFHDVHPIGLNGDHRTMIKFNNNQDPGYRNISELFIRMIQSTLPGHVASPTLPASPFSTLSVPPKPLLRASTMGSIGTQPPPYDMPTTSRLPRDNRASLGPARLGIGIGGRDYAEYSDPFDWTRPSFKAPGDSAQLQRQTLDPNNIPINRLNIMGNTNGQGVSGGEDTSPFRQLAQFDTVFLLDDSGSMTEQDCDDGKSRWNELIQSLRYIVDTVCHYDKDGVDVHFLFNDAKDEPQIQDGQRIMDLLTNEVRPDEEGGGTFMGNPIWDILTRAVDKFEDFRQNIRSASRPERPKKLNLIVITDGAADDKEDVESAIVQAAKRLDALHAPAHQVGIQFLQIGKNVAAGKWLELLDNSLHKMHGMRDIVDTRPWNNPEVINKSFTTRLEQILLGAVSKLDGEETVELSR